MDQYELKRQRYPLLCEEGLTVDDGQTETVLGHKTGGMGRLVFSGRTDQDLLVRVLFGPDSTTLHSCIEFDLLAGAGKGEGRGASVDCLGSFVQVEVENNSGATATYGVDVFLANEPGGGSTALGSAGNPFPVELPSSQTGSYSSEAIGGTSEQVLTAGSYTYASIVNNGSEDMWLGFTTDVIDGSVAGSDGGSLIEPGGSWTNNGYVGDVYLISTGGGTVAGIQEW